MLNIFTQVPDTINLNVLFKLQCFSDLLESLKLKEAQFEGCTGFLMIGNSPKEGWLQLSNPKAVQVFDHHEHKFLFGCTFILHVFSEQFFLTHLMFYFSFHSLVFYC